MDNNKRAPQTGRSGELCEDPCTQGNYDTENSSMPASGGQQQRSEPHPANRHMRRVAAVSKEAAELARQVEQAHENGAGLLLPPVNPDQSNTWINIANTPRQPRDWCLPALPSRRVGILFGAGGVGKGWFMLQSGAALACGLPLLETFGAYPSGQVLYLTAEDDFETLQDRNKSLLNHLFSTHKNRDTILDNLQARLETRSILGGNRMPCMLKEGAVVDEECQRWIDWLMAVCEGRRLVFLDTLSNFHLGNENSNPEMKALIYILQTIALRTGTTIICSHHVGKDAALNSRSEQQASRGASSLIDSVRWAASVRGMSHDEAEGYDVEEDVRHNFLLLTFSKTNLDGRPGSAWFRRSSTTDGDWPGLLVPAVLGDFLDKEERRKRQKAADEAFWAEAKGGEREKVEEAKKEQESSVDQNQPAVLDYQSVFGFGGGGK